ncbi:MAG: ACT domain-containing protein [Anaerolineae bacterium]|nr:ACT domain-containing protein [Anaerolineae bacterium]
MTLLPGRLAVCRLGSASPLPSWAMEAPFFSVTRTEEELSVVCPEGCVPPGIQHEPGWRALKLEGPFPFSAVGVLAAVVGPLAKARVSVLAIATYDTDYILVRETQLEEALSARKGRGHGVA